MSRSERAWPGGSTALLDRCTVRSALVKVPVFSPYCRVIPLYLLSVVVDELLDVGFDEADFRQDLVGGGSPGEWFGVGVPVADVFAYLLDECFNAAESAAADGLAGDDAEPGFNLIDPGRADGGEVKLDVRIILQPRHHLRGSVGGEGCPRPHESLCPCDVSRLS